MMPSIYGEASLIHLNNQDKFRSIVRGRMEGKRFQELLDWAKKNIPPFDMTIREWNYGYVKTIWKGGPVD